MLMTPIATAIEPLLLRNRDTPVVEVTTRGSLPQ
jgi:hypothetical protein